MDEQLLNDSLTSVMIVRKNYLLDNQPHLI